MTTFSTYLIGLSFLGRPLRRLYHAADDLRLAVDRGAVQLPLHRVRGRVQHVEEDLHAFDAVPGAHGRAAEGGADQVALAAPRGGDARRHRQVGG